MSGLNIINKLTIYSCQKPKYRTCHRPNVNTYKRSVYGPVQDNLWRPLVVSFGDSTLESVAFQGYS